MEKLKLKHSQFLESDKREEGRVLPPLLLYFLGVPAFLCVILWLLFFRG